MAQKVEVIFTDDLDGLEGTDDDKVETRRFALDMNVFEADLRRTNWEQLKKEMAPYIAIARPASHEYRRSVAPVNSNSGRRTTHVPAPRDQASRDRSARIRAWAKEKGLPVSERGRIPKDVENQYDVEHPITL